MEVLKSLHMYCLPSTHTHTHTPLHPIPPHPTASLACWDSVVCGCGPAFSGNVVISKSAFDSPALCLWDVIPFLRIVSIRYGWWTPAQCRLVQLKAFQGNHLYFLPGSQSSLLSVCPTLACFYCALYINLQSFACVSLIDTFSILLGVLLHERNCNSKHLGWDLMVQRTLRISTLWLIDW